MSLTCRARALSFGVAASFAAAVVAASCRPAAGPSAPPSSARPDEVTLTVMGTPLTETRSSRVRQEIAEQFTQETGIRVAFVPGMIETSSSELDHDIQLLSSHARTPDIYQIDLVWPGVLADHLLDLRPYWGDAAASHEPFRDDGVVDGRLVSVSYFADVGLLYYRNDLLRKYGYDHPPATWDDLERAATRIQAGERAAGRADFWGFVWQGAAYEGLTCNALEWQVSHGGGAIIESDTRISVNNPAAAQAFARAARWVGTVSPRGVIAYREEDARNVWEAGNAAFMRNWPYAYPLGQEADSIVKDKVAIAPIPTATGRHASTLGGWQLAVSKYTRHAREAAAFVRFMTRRDVQARRAIEAGYLPILPELYRDAAVMRANPHYARLPEIFERGGVVVRPAAVTGKGYEAVSRAYSRQVHRILTGEAAAGAALYDLERELVALTGFRPGV